MGYVLPNKFLSVKMGPRIIYSLIDSPTIDRAGYFFPIKSNRYETMTAINSLGCQTILTFIKGKEN